MTNQNEIYKKLDFSKIVDIVMDEHEQLHVAASDTSVGYVFNVYDVEYARLETIYKRKFKK